MKKIVLLLVLVSSFVMGQAPIYHDVNVDFKIGEQYVLFGDDVKFRKAPDVKSKIIKLLKIGSEVEILEKTSKTAAYNGIESPFYKVSHNEKTGYILGGLISLETKESENATYLFAYKKEEFRFSVLVRSLKKDKTFTELSSPLGNSGLSIKLMDNQGLTGVQNILLLDNRAEACGIMGGDIYFFETETGLKNVFSTTIYSDAGVNWYNEELVFPSDEGGVEDRVVYQREKGENGDEATNELHIYRTSRELRFENGELLPKVQEEGE